MALTQVKTSGIEDDAVTLAKQAAGTDGQIITYDASGNPVAVGPGTDGQVLTSTGAGSPPAFEALPASNNYTHPNHSGEVTSTADGAQVIADDVVDEANLKVSNSPTNGYFLSAQSGNTGGLTWAEAGGTNTPAWSVGLSSNFGTTDGTYVKIPFDSEEFDTDSAFASNKFTVPSGKAGKYMVMFHLRWSGAEDNEVHYAALYKNGSILNTTIRHEDTGDGGNLLTFNYAGLHDLADSDYLEVYFKDGDSGESNSVVAGYARFQGFKLL